VFSSPLLHSMFLGPNIFLSTLFSDNLRCHFLRVRHSWQNYISAYFNRYRDSQAVYIPKLVSHLRYTSTFTCVTVYTTKKKVSNKILRIFVTHIDISHTSLFNSTRGHETESQIRILRDRQLADVHSIEILCFSNIYYNVELQDPTLKDACALLLLILH